MTNIIQVFEDLLRCEIRLYNALEQQLKVAHGLTFTQFTFLRRIAERDRCRVNDIAQDVAITVGAVSKGVDRLEAAGWVLRTPNPENRRSSLLVLTDAGRALLAAATPTVEAALGEWLGAPLGAGLAGFGAAVATVRQAAEATDLGRPTG